MKKLLLISLNLLLFFSLSIAQSIEYDVNAIDKNLLKSSNAVVQLDKTKVVHSRFDRVETVYLKAITVLNAKAKNYLTFIANYEKGDKISDIRIEIRDKTGKLIKKVAPKEIEDVAAGDGFSLVTDSRVKYWSYEPNSYPLTIVYTYKEISKTTLLLPSWNPLSDYDVAVKSSSYELTTTLPTRKKILNFDQYESITSIGEHHYEMKNQASLNKEKFMPSSLVVFPIVFIRPERYSYEGVEGKYDTWEGYANWLYTNFLVKEDKLKAYTIKEELKDLIKTSDAPKVIVEKLYNYIQENTRYISIQLDEGGLNPMSAQKVHEVKYGDCKALSFYMKSLLDIYGIPSNYVEVHAGTEDQIGLFEDFPSAIPGNHIILNIPLQNDTIWVDCTSHDNPFNFLGTFTDNRAALIVSEKGGHLVNTPKYDRSANRKESNLVMTVKEDASMSLEFEMNNKGLAIDDGHYLRKLKGKDLTDFLVEKKFKQLNNVKINNCTFEYDESVPQIKEILDISVSNYAEVAGDYLFIPLTVNMLGIPALPKDKSRIYPIEFTRGYELESTMQFSVPEKYRLLESLDEKFNSIYGSYTYKLVEEKAGSLLLKRSFYINDGQYAAEQYEEIKHFFDQCLKIERSPITLQYMGN